MTERLVWDISQEGELTKVAVKGSIDEDADFSSLTQDLKGNVKLRFDMSGVARVNSCGVREWMNFIRAISGTSQVDLEGCSPVVVSQINMISNFTGAARVLSVQAPFVCDECGHEENVLLQVSDRQRPALDDFKCPACSATMQFDDIEDSYFAFLA